jgi:DNA excision repair protein ERCC-2
MTRRLINHANILVYNYQYTLDPRISNVVSAELENECIVVFDEAHNIDNVCIEALSVTVDKKMIDSSIRNVNELQRKVVDLKASDSARLQKEYNELLRGLTDSSIRRNNTTSNALATTTTSSSSQHPEDTSSQHSNTLQRFADSMSINQVLPKDLLEEAIPGNIRKAEHFLSYLKKIILYMKSYFNEKDINTKDVENHTPLAFLHLLQEKTGLERKPLRFTQTRMTSLLRTLEITALDDFIAVNAIANFVTMVASYLEGFAVIFEPKGSIVSGVTEPLVHLACLDASIAIKPVFEKFQSVIITSGTLSPIDFYPKLLNFKPILRVSLPMSTFRPCLLPLIVTRGSDQIAISTRFELRKDIAVIRNYGHLLLEVVANVPDGVCCFFTSYLYMEYVISVWDKMNILNQVMEHKLIYLETKDVVETTLALENYRRACDCGRGAVFFSIARGKVAEGIDFDRHYGRAVLLFGIPYQYTLSHVLKARLNFMREKYNIRDNDFLTFDALRQSAQCIGRVIRSKTDYGIVILADSRYNRQDKRSKLPPWVVQFIHDSCMNLSTDVAIDQMKQFLKKAGQPIEESALRTILLDEKDIQLLNQSQQYSYGGAIPNTPQPAISLLSDIRKGQQQEEENEDLMILSEEPLEDELMMVDAGAAEGERMVASDILPVEKGNVPATGQLMDIPRIVIDPQKNKYASLFLFDDE